MSGEGMHVHSFEQIVVPSTCRENGYTLHRCSCGYEFKNNFKPLGGHVFEMTNRVMPTCEDKGSMECRCRLCGAVTVNEEQALGHAWGQWNVQSYPSCTQDGKQVRECQRCLILESQDIPATGHKLVNPQASATYEGMLEGFCENCGQVVLQPIPPKKPSFFKRHKKGLIAAIIAIVLVAGLAVATPLYFIPAFHYMSAMSLIKKGDYTEAYYHLKDCGTFSNAEMILEDFRICYEEVEEIYYDEDGEESTRCEYTYHDSGEMETELYYRDDKLSTKTEYDEYGNQVYYCEYNTSGKVSYEYKNEYEYDSDGNMLLSIEYDDDGTVRERTEYDSNGNETFYLYVYSDGDVTKYTVEYDEDGNRIKKTHYNRNDVIDYYYTYQYDEDGNEICRIEYDGDGIMESKTVYEYDKAGFRTVEADYGKNNQLLEKTTYTRNSNFDLISSVTVDGDGKEINSRSYEYEYDYAGNITLEIVYDKDGKEINRYEFEHEYHFNGNLKKSVERSEGKVSCIYEYDFQGNNLSYTYYWYDINGDYAGKIIRERDEAHELNIEYNKDNRITNRSETKYDEHGTLASRYEYELYDENEEPYEWETTYELEYDKYDVLESSVGYDIDGNKRSETTYSRPFMVYEPSN